jgi:hypothetical protein
MATPNPKNRERRKKNQVPLEARSVKIQDELIHGMYDFEYNILQGLHAIFFDIVLDTKTELHNGLVHHIYNKYDDGMIKQIRDHLDKNMVSYNLIRNGHVEIHVKR